MDMRFGTWNVRSLYRAGSVMPVANRILVEKLGGTEPLGRRRRRWVGNNEMYLREISWGGMDWTDLAQCSDQWRTLVNMSMKFRVHKMLGSS
jgi:hypothetical protein